MPGPERLIDGSLHLLFALGYLGFSAASWSAGKRWVAMASLVFGTAWLFYYRSILKWITHLGSDSFSEAQNFALSEALTFLETITQVLEREGLGLVAATLLAGFTGLLLVNAVGRRLLGRRWSPGSAPLVIAALVLAAGTWLLQIYPAFGAFRWNSQYYQGIYDNFHTHSELRLNAGTPLTALNVIVHIGESNTSMNMGIYGYPRPTTPELEAFASANKNLLVFHDVLSTHTHTAPSLLEALSIGFDPAEDFLPISDRRRTSIIDLLQQAAIPTALISNQGRTGAWNNLASTIVFRNVDVKEFSFDSTWMGEMEHFASRPLDHEFLLPAIERHGLLEEPGPRVSFLHSYAGHSPYWRNIAPEFRVPVDDLMERLPEAVIVGDGIANPQHTIRRIEQYDSTIRYIDHLVSSVLRRVEAAPHPAVYIYFADHGEAVYAGRGHDSSRFLHEMARVPFLVYFNDAAAQDYPDILRRFREAARAQRISTLAQFSPSLLALFGLSVDGAAGRGIGLDDVDTLPPILTRETAAGLHYIQLGNSQPGQAHSAPLVELRDPHTLIFRTTRRLHEQDGALCVQRAHTLGKALRGSIIANCLHAELSIGAGEQTGASVEGAASSAISISNLAAFTRAYNIYLLLHINNVPADGQCDDLLRSFEDSYEDGSPRGLAMFPPTALEPGFVQACLQHLGANGIEAGIRLPSELADECLESSTGPPYSGSACERLKDFVREARQSAVFLSLGVKAHALDLIDGLGHDTASGWAVLDYPLDGLDKLPDPRARWVVLESINDPNAL
jgi:hypothetical protein